ncbi:hypothetical protein CR205_10210 [Alteribacter lacisalsi]|uniref:DUF421 domain-containing protein n=1 Tax=Alteribacter lacisalsi TaxID=2045244 RepID=A0A2W0HYP9_9BACI|nr:DUF421 domain-containing protein [Alteribacter lacisalsi]PYZ98918.1 hypothetical protein CR205_10210 [Alteribacter lacisalsi]
MGAEITEVVLRSFGAYTLLMIINYCLGKQTLSQMTNHDFITAVMMGAIGANLAFDLQVSYWYSFTALLVIGGIGYGTTWMSLKNRGMRGWFSGTPTVFIEDGRILEKNLKKQKYNMDSLNQSLREKDVFDITEVEYAVLEPDGHLSVMKREKSTDGDNRRFPVELIMDGKIIERNLRSLKLSERWLYEQLKRRNAVLEEVFYCVRGPDGTLAFDFYEDHITNPVDKER